MHTILEVHFKYISQNSKGQEFISIVKYLKFPISFLFSHKFLVMYTLDNISFTAHGIVQ